MKQIKQEEQSYREKLREANCYCHNCKKYFHSLGIMRHRAMHRDRGENVEITYKYGDTIKHNYGGTK